MAAPSWWSSTIVIVVVLSIVTAAVVRLVDCQKHSLERRIRSSLQYPEESEMGLFFALAVPLDDPDTTKAISMALFFEANYKLTSAEEKEGHKGNHTTTTTTTEKSPTEELKTQGDIIDRRGVYRLRLSGQGVRPEEHLRDHESGRETARRTQRAARRHLKDHFYAIVEFGRVAGRGLRAGGELHEELSRVRRHLLGLSDFHLREHQPGRRKTRRRRQGGGGAMTQNFLTPRARKSERPAE
ncbi:unnamed protein product [Trichogramma brassicae]|uniref:Uncharacterized protein n=1 Tax=Trichogramma brassicae TaxID=86971 RepID=A0A6H5ISF7_9HYME|nr:unnamed protein product [Trichogramma brassicae]